MRCTDTAGDVIQQFRDHYGFDPSSRVALFFNGKRCLDTSTLFSCDIEQNSFAFLGTEEEFSQFTVANGNVWQSGQIFVKTLTNKTITLEVKFCDDIGDIKYLIERKECIPYDEQRIISNGRQLDDGHFLWD